MHEEKKETNKMIRGKKAQKSRQGQKKRSS